MKKILFALFLMFPQMALVSAKAKADTQQTDEVSQLDQMDSSTQFRRPPGRCDGSPIYSGMGLFTAAGLPGWCDAYPNAGLPWRVPRLLLLRARGGGLVSERRWLQHGECEWRRSWSAGIYSLLLRIEFTV